MDENSSSAFSGDAQMLSLAGAWQGSVVIRAQTESSGLSLAIPHRPPPSGGHLSLDLLLENPAERKFRMILADHNERCFYLSFSLKPYIQARLRLDFEDLNLQNKALPAEGALLSPHAGGDTIKPHEIRHITLALDETSDTPIDLHLGMLKLFRDRPPSLTTPAALRETMSTDGPQ